MSRAWRRALLVVFGLPALLIVALVFFYLVENFRGSRAWNSYKSALKTRGESLDPADFAPAAVPDDQNLLAAEPLRSWINAAGRFASTNPMPSLRQMEPGNWQRARLTRLREWTAIYGVDPGGRSRRTNILSAAEVLASMASAEPGIRQVIEAARERPQSRFNASYATQDRPGHEFDQTLLPALAVRASAHLARRDPANGLAGTLLLLRLAETVKDYPRYAALLCRAAAVNTALQPLWEGLAVHAWRDADLIALQKALTNINLIAEAGAALRGERACVVRALGSKRWQRLRFNTSQRLQRVRWIDNRL